MGSTAHVRGEMDIKLEFFSSPPPDVTVTVVVIPFFGLDFRPRPSSHENLAGAVGHKNLELHLFMNNDWADS